VPLRALHRAARGIEDLVSAAENGGTLTIIS
jgi:hypothetical protein